MGKKRVGETPNTPSLPKKSSRAFSSSNVPIWSKGKNDASRLILSPSTKGLHFVSDKQKLKYQLFITKKIAKQKYCHVESLRALGMEDDVGTVLENLGWLDYMEMKCVL